MNEWTERRKQEKNGQKKNSSRNAYGNCLFSADLLSLSFFSFRVPARAAESGRGSHRPAVSIEHNYVCINICSFGVQKKCHFSYFRSSVRPFVRCFSFSVFIFILIVLASAFSALDGRTRGGHFNYSMRFEGVDALCVLYLCVFCIWFGVLASLFRRRWHTFSFGDRRPQSVNFHLSSFSVHINMHFNCRPDLIKSFVHFWLGRSAPKQQHIFCVPVTRVPSEFDWHTRLCGQCIGGRRQ